MSSHHQSHFQPPPPIRTSTYDSQKSLSSGPASPTSEIASPTFGRRQTAASPTEESFFGAIAGRMRRGRSRSRSRGAVSRNRSKSPMVLPPEHFPPTSNAQPMSPTYAAQQVRQSRADPSLPTSPKAIRPSLQGINRRSTAGSDPWRGRHSNEWLFGGFSVTQTTKDILHIGRKP